MILLDNFPNRLCTCALLALPPLGSAHHDKPEKLRRKCRAMAGGRGSDDEEKSCVCHRHVHARPRRLQQAGLGAKMAGTGVKKTVVDS